VKLESKPLDWWINNLEIMPRDIWLWIPSETEVLRPDTQCYVVDDGAELSPEEQDQRDIDLEDCGLACFFCKDQLEDIEQNLKQQKSDYDQRDLYEALNVYWENDAFIQLGSV